MRFGFLAILGVALVTGACAAPESDDADSSSDAIIGGHLANGEHHEVVSLVMNGEWCTGTLVGSRTILTARHCLKGLTRGADQACVGVAYVDTTGEGAGAAKPYVYQRCVVPDLGDPTWRNDFGFIRLDVPVEGVVPAKIATAKPATDTFTAYGYGMFGERSCTDVPDGNKRSVTYRGKLSSHDIRLMCHGDSGGPHFVSGTNVIAAITSGGNDWTDLQATTYAYPEHLVAYVARLEAP